MAYKMCILPTMTRQHSPDNMLGCRSISFKGNVVISITFDDQRWVH